MTDENFAFVQLPVPTHQKSVWKLLTWRPRLRRWLLTQAVKVCQLYHAKRMTHRKRNDVRVENEEERIQNLQNHSSLRSNLLLLALPLVVHKEDTLDSLLAVSHCFLKPVVTEVHE